MNTDLLPVNQSPEPQSLETDEVSVIQQFVLDLVAAGKSQDEVTSEIEKYYDQLSGKCNEDIVKL